MDDLDSDIRNLLYAFYDYDCFSEIQNDQKHRHKSSTFSFKPCLELLQTSCIDSSLTNEEKVLV
jgi:hypothetical protein